MRNKGFTLIQLIAALMAAGGIFVALANMLFPPKSGVHMDTSQTNKVEIIEK